MNSTIRRRRCVGHGVDHMGVTEQQLPAQIVGTTKMPASRDAPEHGVVGEGAVLDAVHTSIDRVLDPTAGVRVRGDGLEVVVGDLHRGPQLGQRVLDGPCVLGLRGQHGPGRHDLDQVRAPGELPADGGPHLLRDRPPPRTSRGSSRRWPW